MRDTAKGRKIAGLASLVFAFTGVGWTEAPASGVLAVEAPADDPDAALLAVSVPDRDPVTGQRPRPPVVPDQSWAVATTTKDGRGPRNDDRVERSRKAASEAGRKPGAVRRSAKDATKTTGSKGTRGTRGSKGATKTPKHQGATAGKRAGRAARPSRPVVSTFAKILERARSLTGASRDSVTGDAWTRMCDRLAMRVATGSTTSGYPSAKAHWEALRAEGTLHTEVGDPDQIPVGALMFYDTASEHDHAAVKIDADHVISTDADGTSIGVVPTAVMESWGPLVGWAVPPGAELASEYDAEAEDLLADGLAAFFEARSSTGVVHRLDATQLEYAMVIAEIGYRGAAANGLSRTEAEDAIQIAYMAVLSESGFKNYASLVYPETVGRQHPRTAIGSSHDSVGLFQQRPRAGWGTPAQAQDPAAAARAFFGGRTGPHAGSPQGLFDHRGWQQMSKGAAAHHVQVSAHPDRYRTWEKAAGDLLDVVRPHLARASD